MIYKSGFSFALFYITSLLCKISKAQPEFSPVSIWEPFCREPKLYVPYVRVFHKGRRGELLKDRGPGFMDLTGLSDIYVCTNGLTMMYYSKTTAMGEVYEQGELHWTPHHCELYNPSSNNGLKPDFPRKLLLAVLLLGHPQDYRTPSMQMFTSPLYDPVYNGYVNATSLIMIGNDGECLIEKGEERARLRVRLEQPKIYDKIDQQNTAGADATPPKKIKIYPASFCQLDTHKKLGQMDKGLINLKISNRTFVTFRERKSPMLKYTEFWSLRNKSRQSGCSIEPRFRATAKTLFNDTNTAEPVKNLAEYADYVYATLLADRPLRFVGCFRYPIIDSVQAMLVFDKGETWQNYNPDAILYSVTPASGASTSPEHANHTFWIEAPKAAPWKLDDPVKNRYNIYLEKDIHDDKWDVTYQSILEKINTTEDEFEKAKNAAPPVPDDIAKAENALKEQQFRLSLWPYIAIYNEISVYVRRIFTLLQVMWKDDARSGMLASPADAMLDVSTRPFGRPLKEYLKMKPDELAERRLELGNDLSRSRINRHNSPYDAKLEAEHQSLLDNYTDVSTVLLLMGTRVQPIVSDAEALTAKFKTFKEMLGKAHENIKEAIRYMERTKLPAKPPMGGDPLEKTFTDTIIEIADAVKPDGNPYEEKDPEFSQARACQLLPTLEGTCEDIRPTSLRASKMLKNRKGKGLDWNVEDLWREKVMTVIEEIFHKVCPYVSVDFPIGINRIIKGYLLGDPAGTGLKHPVNGSMLDQHDHNYQGEVYNSTYYKISPSNDTVPPSFGWQPPPKLTFKTPFWELILHALDFCNEHAVPMQFWHNEEGEKPSFITYRKVFPNNNTEYHYEVDELYMREKAEMEYVFNWAIDMNWKMFATVLGYCMPKYEVKIPLITARFYALYSQDFLFPLRQIWMSNRDNPILKTILGSFYGNGAGEKWVTNCMEASFVESGDRSYRPPRYLYVNAFTEMNYFTTGPLVGTSGMLAMLG